jgi:hypothetical protein
MAGVDLTQHVAGEATAIAPRVGKQLDKGGKLRPDDPIGKSASPRALSA